VSSIHFPTSNLTNGKNYFGNLYPVLSYLLKTQLLVLGILSIIRYILLSTNLQNIEGVEASSVRGAFMLGFFLDNITVSYVTLPPLIGAFLVAFIDKTKILRYCYNIYCIIAYSIVFGFTISDIPYFAYFFKHIDVSALDWLKHDTDGINMLLTESSYYKYYLLFFVIVLSFSALIIYFSKIWKKTAPVKNTGFRNIKFAVLAITLGFICYLGIFKKYIPEEEWFDSLNFYKYYLLLLIIIGIIAIASIYYSKIWERNRERIIKSKIVQYVIPVFLIVITPLLIAIKDNKMRPILDWTPYMNENSFINELTISPLYYYIFSITSPKEENKNINFVTDEEAIDIIRKDFANQNFETEISPICRKAIPDKAPLNANVIIVLMESMSDYYLNETKLTPYLNELIGKSIYFNNFYSPGTHTNQGVFSTLYGNPAFFSRIITDDRAWISTEPTPLCDGLPVNLSKEGYLSQFFIPHEKSYNNMDMFLYKNGYDLKNIYSSENYPAGTNANRWGVPDNFLFDFFLKTIKTAEKQPFFSTIMTITNHPEYVVPDEFMKISEEPSERTVYYADYCIRQFMDKASKEDWYDNTIFVFVGDHGKLLGKQELEMPLSLNHIPLIIYSPLFTPKVVENAGTQIDIFPTIMGLLNIEYQNNSLGIDLLVEKRQYAVFTSDDKLGCTDGQYLYCYNTLSGQEVLYDYKAGNKNIKESHPEIFQNMREYASAMVQTTNYLYKNRLTKIQ